jgi:NhaA family Na+:H+ antiporter
MTPPDLTPEPEADDRSVLGRASDRAGAFAEFLREETTGGQLLLVATAIALIWANLSESSYVDFWGTTLDPGPEWLHLHLTLEAWAADGLLALFFFVAGVELKRELVVGELSNRRAAALPILAAIGGMIVPALIAIAVSGGAALDDGGWAVPVATDIAFALGVLSLAGAALPGGVRAILLSIAVVDDLLAIALIAIVFTTGLALGWLAAGLLACVVWSAAFRFRFDRAPILIAIALIAWICIHASGIHATVAGILLGLLTPVRPREGERKAAGGRFEHRLHPLSAGVCVPLFALSATGIPIAAVGGITEEKVALGVVAGLLIGKVVGIFGGARLAVRLGVGTLPENVRWSDVLPVAVLGSIGFTVSLLISSLAFDDEIVEERVAAAILVSAVIASVVAVFLLRRQSRPA